MATRLLKCYGDCGGKFTKEDLTKFKNKNYCSDCLENIKNIDSKKDELYSYIKKIYNTNPTILHHTQIKNYTNKGITFDELIRGAKYIYDVECKRLTYTDGLGYILNSIDKARTYYDKVQVIKDRNKEKLTTITEINNVVVVNTSISNIENQYIKSKKINLEDIL